MNHIRPYACTGVMGCHTFPLYTHSAVIYVRMYECYTQSPITHPPYSNLSLNIVAFLSLTLLHYCHLSSSHFCHLSPHTSVTCLPHTSVTCHTLLSLVILTLLSLTPLPHTLQVTPSGAAAASGKLKVGDRILQVCMHRHTHSQSYVLG